MTDGNSPVTPSPRRRNQRRRGIIAVMIASLLASAGARYWADSSRATALPHRGSDAAASGLGGMNSFALGLLLGGLRGPLVMLLWTQSESQKVDKNLEGVDTQIEWIRLLQPEFDTVHIFQIWNKAYNISVQMASRANKYSVIFGAVDYARSVDAEKPDDINIVAAIGQLYFDKFGNSAEKYYYRKRVREETLPHPVQNFDAGRGVQRTKLDPIVDADGNILPALTRPRYDSPRKPGDVEYDNGADLQYLPQFQPYPDGVFPFAVAYNYYKRSEVLQSVYKQHHDQLSDQVVDSRPAIALKFCAEECIDQGRRREFQAFGRPYPDDLNDPTNLDAVQVETAPITVRYGPITDPRAMRLAIDDYDQAVKFAAESEVEYVRHILNYPQQESLYRSHRDEIGAEAAMAAGDRDFLKATLATGAEQTALLGSARDHYDVCIDFSTKSLIRYYLDPQMLAADLPPAYVAQLSTGRKTLGDMPRPQLREVLIRDAAFRRANPQKRQNQDRGEFDRFIQRSLDRQAGIDSTTTPPTTRPAG